MAKYVINDTTLTSIADGVRKVTGTSATMKPSEMATALKNVDVSFWDKYQQNGNRLDYSYAFAGHGWTDETFKPKYNIKPRSISYMFSVTQITDLCKLLDECGVVIDLSDTVAISYFVNGSSSLQTIPTLDVSKTADLSYLISNNSALRSIEKLILADGTQRFSAYSFNGNPALEEIRFEGVIGSSLAIKDSPLLSSDSVQSIIDCLKDLTGATAQTLTLHSDVIGRMTTEQTQEIRNKNWTLA